MKQLAVILALPSEPFDAAELFATLLSPSIEHLHIAFAVARTAATGLSIEQLASSASWQAAAALVAYSAIGLLCLDLVNSVEEFPRWPQRLAPSASQALRAVLHDAQGAHCSPCIVLFSSPFSWAATGTKLDIPSSLQ